jgi:hypothetical protein
MPGGQDWSHESYSSRDLKKKNKKRICKVYILSRVAVEQYLSVSLVSAFKRDKLDYLAHESELWHVSTIAS